MKKLIQGSENYTARVVKIERVRKHPNADRLWIVTVFGQNVITGVKPTEGELMVFFPALSQINKTFVSMVNGFAEKELNVNQEERGMFNKHARVKAIKLRDEISEGYLHPIKDIEIFTGTKLYEGDSFNEVNGIEFCIKYTPPVKTSSERKIKSPKVRRERKSILVDNQFQFHVDTKNLRYCLDQINPYDTISVTYKYHGTSFSVQNVLTKRKLNLLEKIALKLGIPVKTTEYKLLYGSRKVVKNQYEGQDSTGFYKEDVWKLAMDRIGEFIPKGWCVYGEIVGYLPSGGAIQSMSGKAYDYGCKPNEFNIVIYRIRVVNEDGISHELSTQEIKDFCFKYGLNTPEVFHYGAASQRYPEISTRNVQEWREEFIKRLEEDYNEKDCFKCINRVPEEGVVIRKENLFRYESYKLKSKAFLLQESSEQDDESFVDIEL